MEHNATATGNAKDHVGKVEDVREGDNYTLLGFNDLTRALPMKNVKKIISYIHLIGSHNAFLIINVLMCNLAFTSNIPLAE